MSKGVQDRLILSLDLSLNGTGVAVLKPYKNTVKIVETLLIDNSRIDADNLPEKLANIYFNLSEVFQRHKITDVVREKGFARFATVTQKLFRVVGVVDFVLYCEGFTSCIPEITPTAVKKEMTGKGKADKEDVAKGLQRYLNRQQKESGVYFQSDDISDAVAVGITYCIQNGIINRK